MTANPFQTAPATGSPDGDFDLDAHHCTEVLLATHQVLVARCVIEFDGQDEAIESELVIPRRECLGDRPRGLALLRAAQERLSQLLLSRPGRRPSIRIPIGRELVRLAMV